MQPGQVYAFDRFVLDPDRRTLTDAGREVPLGARALDVLIALVRRAGTVVSKDDLIAEAWGGVVVEENSIAAQVAAVRRALDCGTQGRRLILTVSGRGYRFVEPLIDTPAAAAATASASPDARRPSRSTTLALAAAALVAVLAGGFAAWRATSSAEPAAWSPQDMRETVLLTPPRLGHGADTALQTFATDFNRALARRFTAETGALRLATSADAGRVPRFDVTLEFEPAAGGGLLRTTLRDHVTGERLLVRESKIDPRAAPTEAQVFQASAQIKVAAVRHAGALSRAKPEGARDSHDDFLVAMSTPPDHAHIDAAVRLLEKSYAASPGQTIVRDALASALQVRALNAWSADPAADNRRAFALAQRSLVENSQDLFALAAVTEAHAMEGRWQDVIVAADRALAIRPSYAEMLFEKGMAEMALGRFADAERTEARLAPLKSPRNAAYVERLSGLLRFHQGRYAEAATHLREAVQETPPEELARPQSGGLSLYLAGAEALKGDLAEARRVLGDFRKASNVANASAFWRWNDNLRFPLVDRDRLAAGLARAGWGG